MTRTPEKPSILLLGAGGHARACIDVIELDGSYAIAGLIGVAPEVGSSVLGYPVLGTDADLPQLLARYGCGVVTVGQIKTPEPRMHLFAELEKRACLVPAIVSPRAYVSPHARVGHGTVVLHGAVINAGATVGRNCIVNSMALVEHDVVVGDHCHIATGARINSGVRVGDGSFIGSGASVRQGISIGRKCIIGMGQALRCDLADGMQIPQRRTST